MNARGPLGPLRFRSWIAGRLGLHFDDGKLDFLADVLSRRAHASGREPIRYLDRLESADPEPELRSLAPELTVPETYFFRHMEQFRAFSEVALVEAARRSGGVTPLRILSAGCASGEEPYSLAMSVHERGIDLPRGASIRAVDINADMLEKARRGIYSSWSLRETPPDMQRRWFHGSGRDFELDGAIRAAVSFREANLAQDHSDLWTALSYDVIFCRNVLMYFTPEAAQALVARLTRALVPGGHLFLGHAETLRGLSSSYHLCHTHGTFYYQRKAADSIDAAHPFGAADSGRGAGANHGAALLAEGGDPGAALPIEADGAWAATWLETIRQTS